MTSEQIASLEPWLIELLEKFRSYFRREKTFEYWLKYILGLLADVKHKSIEPIALATDVPVHTLQEFLVFFRWDHQRADNAGADFRCAQLPGVEDLETPVSHVDRNDRTMRALSVL